MEIIEDINQFEEEEYDFDSLVLKYEHTKIRRYLENQLQTLNFKANKNEYQIKNLQNLQNNNTYDKDKFEEICSELAEKIVTNLQENKSFQKKIISKKKEINKSIADAILRKDELNEILNKNIPKLNKFIENKITTLQKDNNETLNKENCLINENYKSYCKAKISEEEEKIILFETILYLKYLKNNSEKITLEELKKRKAILDEQLNKLGKVLFPNSYKATPYYDFKQELKDSMIVFICSKLNEILTQAIGNLGHDFKKDVLEIEKKYLIDMLEKTQIKNHQILNSLNRITLNGEDEYDLLYKELATDSRMYINDNTTPNPNFICIDDLYIKHIINSKSYLYDNYFNKKEELNLGLSIINTLSLTSKFKLIFRNLKDKFDYFIIQKEKYVIEEIISNFKIEIDSIIDSLNQKNIKNLNIFNKNFEKEANYQNLFSDEDKKLSINEVEVVNKIKLAINEYVKLNYEIKANKILQDFEKYLEKFSENHIMLVNQLGILSNMV